MITPKEILVVASWNQLVPAYSRANCSWQTAGESCTPHCKCEVYECCASIPRQHGHRDEWDWRIGWTAVRWGIRLRRVVVILVSRYVNLCFWKPRTRTKDEDLKCISNLIPKSACTLFTFRLYIPSMSMTSIKWSIFVTNYRQPCILIYLQEITLDLIPSKICAMFYMKSCYVRDLIWPIISLNDLYVTSTWVWSLLIFICTFHLS